MVEVKYFASFREQAGRAAEQFEPAPNSCVDDVIKALVAQDTQLSFLNSDKVLIALNQTLSSRDVAVKSGDELAFFPPVTGG